MNDWEQEINPHKCIKKQICNQKKQVPIGKKGLEKFFSDQYQDYSSHSTFYLTEDDFGRFICYSMVCFYDETNGYTWKYDVILFNPDSTYSIFTPTDYYNYQDELKQFKDQNCWNQPLDAVGTVT